MSSDKLNDAQLLQIVRGSIARDPRAVEQLFASLLPRVRNLVRYLVRADRDVDDLSQDALVTILRGLSSYRGDGSFYSWADRVVARSVFATLRRRSLIPAAPLGKVELEQLESPTGGHTAEYLARRELARLLDQLPPEQRVALALRYVLGFSVKEIATECNVPEETVRSRLRLGKNRLRSILRTDIEVVADHAPTMRQVMR